MGLGVRNIVYMYIFFVIYFVRVCICISYYRARAGRLKDGDVMNYCSRRVALKAEIRAISKRRYRIEEGGFFYFVG